MASPKNEHLLVSTNEQNEYDLNYARLMLNRKIEESRDSNQILTQELISHQAGISISFVQRLLAGTTKNPRKHNLMKLYEWLGINGVPVPIDPFILDMQKRLEIYGATIPREALNLIDSHMSYIFSLTTGYVPNNISTAKDRMSELYPDQWKFGLRALADYVTINNPELRWDRLAVGRERPTLFGKEETKEYETYIRGHEDGYKTAMGSDQRLISELLDEYPSGGVFDYSIEKGNRGITPRPNIWSLVASVKLRGKATVTIRLQSGHQYDIYDHRLLLSTVQSYLTNQGYNLQPSSQEYYKHTSSNIENLLP